MINDSEGNIWMAGSKDSMINVWDGNSFTYYKLEGMYNECLFEDNEGNIWAGSYNNDGVAKFDGTSWSYYNTEDGLLGGIVEAITQDAEGNMLFTTFNGISKFDGTNWSELLVDGNSFYAQEMMFDSKNRLWVCGSSVKMFDNNNWTDFPETTNAYVYGIDEDIQGNIWLAGYSSRMLYKYDGTSLQSFSAEDGLINSSVPTVKADHNGNIWAGTRHGVSFLDMGYTETTVTFNCNMNYQIESGNFIVDEDFVDIAGSFNSYSGTVITDPDKDGIYSLLLEDVTPGETLEFKARINGDWETSEFPGGGPNRTYLVQEGENIVDFWYNDVTSVEQISELSSGIKVYPNPNDGSFNIRFDFQRADMNIDIVNYKGQIILSRQISVMSGQVENIDLNNISTGIYTIHLYNESESATQTFVIW